MINIAEGENMSDYQLIQVSHDQHVGRICLNNPDKLNALSPQMAEEIIKAVDWLESQDLRCLVLTGSGRLFCSGQDLVEAAKQSGSLDTHVILESYYHPMLAKLRACKMPVVTVLNGPAVGFGVGMALMGDLIIAHQTTYWMIPFSKIGLIPDGGATYWLTRLLGKSRMMAMFYLNEQLHADELLSLGLVNRVCDDQQLESCVNEVVKQLVDGPTHAYQVGRQLIHRAFDQAYESQLADEAEQQGLCAKSKEAALGIRAFLKKEKPRFHD